MDQIVAIFSNNLINCLLLMAFLVFMWMRLTPSMFASRKDKIERALKEAEQARIEGQEFFEKQEARIANAEQEAGNILEEARKLAEAMKAEIAGQSEHEAKALKERISQEINAEYQQALSELRTRAAKVSIQLAQSSLPSALTASANMRLLSDFVEQLDKTDGGNGT